MKEINMLWGRLMGWKKNGAKKNHEKKNIVVRKIHKKKS